MEKWGCLPLCVHSVCDGPSGDSDKLPAPEVPQYESYRYRGTSTEQNRLCVEIHFAYTM